MTRPNVCGAIASPSPRKLRRCMRIIRHLWTTKDDATEVRTSYQYLFESRKRLEEALRIAREELGKTQVRRKRYYDRKIKERSMEVADKVLLLRPTDSNKLIMQWKGPYQVEAKRSVNDYRIKVRGNSKTYHINLLKKYQERAKDGEVVKAVNRNPMMVGSAVLERVCSAIIEDDESCGSDDAVDDSELLDLGACQANESLGGCHH